MNIECYPIIVCVYMLPIVCLGWVRIERIDGVGAAQRAFWHVVRSTLGSAQAAGADGLVRRPRSLAPAPNTAPALAVDV